MRMRYRSWLAMVALVLVACGDDGAGDGPDDAADAAIEADSGGRGGGAWTELVTGTWELAPGNESYWCARLTVPETMWISGFRALAPTGTHHTVLTVADGGGSDGEQGCGPGTNEDAMLFASGVGTDDYNFPEGVAVELEAGQQLLLNLHVYNVTDAPLSGTSGVEVRTIAESEVEHRAEMVFAGTVAFSIPGSGEDYQASGACTFEQRATVLNLWPHMHQLGVHMTVDHDGDVLLDEPYSFEEQRNYPIEPRVVEPGQSLRVTCTWNNPAGNDDVRFGDSSDTEMCFVGFYRYPADPDENLFCDIPFL